MTYSDGTNSGFSRRNHYVGQPAVKVGSSNFNYYRKPEKVMALQRESHFCVLSTFDSMA